MKLLYSILLVGLALPAYSYSTQTVLLPSNTILQQLSRIINPKKVYCIDWDGIVAKDEGISKQLRLGFSAVPKSVAITVLGRNIITFIKIAMNKFVLKRGTYKANGDRCIGHTDYIELLAENAPEIKPYMTQIMQKCAQAEPHWDTIKQVQKWHSKGYFIIVWTNNNGPMFQERLKELNRRLAERNEPELKVDAYFVTGSGIENGSPVGKPKVEYYQRSWVYTLKALAQHGITDSKNTKFYFIDDKTENIEGAQLFAQSLNGKEQGSLMALLHENQVAFKKVLDEAKAQKQEQEVVI